MGKYNNGQSFDPSKMSDEEFAIAAYEWAEGSKPLEELLHECRSNGITTSGSHVGKDNAYLGLDVDVSPRHQIEQMLSSLDRFRNTQMFFMSDGGNPRSGPRWYVPSICVDVIKEAYPDVLFEQLLYALKHPKSEETPFSAMLKLYDVLANSRTFMDVRLQKMHSTNYQLSFEFWEGPRSAYCENYFTNLGFTKTRYAKDAGPIVMYAQTRDAKAAPLKIAALASKIAATFAPPKEFNINRFAEQCICILDTEGADAATAYIDKHRRSKL